MRHYGVLRRAHQHALPGWLACLAKPWKLAATSAAAARVAVPREEAAKKKQEQQQEPMAVPAMLASAGEASLAAEASEAVVQELELKNWM